MDAENKYKVEERTETRKIQHIYKNRMNIGQAHDDKERLAIEKRRQRDEERRRRFIEDPKTRMVGVDKDALDAQIAEKKAREDAEREERMAYDHYALSVAKQAEMVEMIVTR
jgi:hypothetical protein